jgi:RecA-family ATPase
VSDLHLSIGQRNGNGRQQVVVRNGAENYSGVIDVRNDYQRQELLKHALQSFALGTENIVALDAQLWKLAQQKDQQAAPTLPAIQDACELCATELVLPQALVQGVLHRGSKLSLGGASKSYKTWTLLLLALCVAYGLPWLGCETIAVKVLFLNLEIQTAFIQRRLKALAQSLGITQEPGRLDVWNLRGHATSHQEIFPKIAERVGDGAYGLVVLDPIYKLYGSSDNENAAGDVAGLMNSVESLAVKTGAAVAFGAHYSKGNQSSKEAIDRVSGSGVFARDPDSLLNFTTHQEADCYTVEATLRNFPPMDPFVVRWEYPLFARDGTLDPAELKKMPGRNKADKAADQERLDGERRERLLTVLRTAPEGDTERALSRMSHLNQEQFGRAMVSLLQEGRAVRCQVIKNRRPEDGFRPSGK